MKVETKITINATARQVWEIFTDDTLLSQWLQGFKSIKTISGEPLQQGSKHQMTFTEGNKEMVFIETVTKCVYGKEYAFNLSHENLVSQNAVLLTEHNGKTELCQKTHMKPHKFIVKLILPFMKRAIRKRNCGNLERLKTLVENQRNPINS
ncbi:SRPBCC family protein [Fulvivirgaceae bacterium BMA12]|uniref:SRPBCC family protein n=1 Tax=Agaribacillus aureus TaxID=3051825 RepID=A0ABT8LCM7_9BACT|nr:SRPBCC family protein [Fulvivirgaceae bacterium BMA12]